MERRSSTTLIRGVLFDRDGTLIVNVPYNADPGQVVPMPGARVLLDAIRLAGIRVGILSNQSGIARGLLTADDVAAVNERVDRLLGPFDVWQVCPYGPDVDARTPNVQEAYLIALRAPCECFDAAVERLAKQP